MPRKRGRPRKSVEQKIREGTYNPTRERKYREADRRAEAVAQGIDPDTLEPEPEEGDAQPSKSPAIKIIPDPEPKQDFLAVMERYMTEVESGLVTLSPFLPKAEPSKWVRAAVARQRKDWERAKSDPESPFAWSPFFAVKACAFLERLPHVEGRWFSPLIKLEPWQVFVVCCLFGWRYKEDSLKRRFTLLYLETGRKNAKSTLMAGIALYHLMREEEPGAQVICGATTGSQARVVFNIAAAMVNHRLSDWMREEGMRAGANAITCYTGVMKPINAKASTQDGLNPSCIVLDEAHAQNFELHDVLKSAQGARENPLMLCPTTAGYNLLSVGYAMRSTVQKILSGIFEAEHYLGLIYAIDEGDDWNDKTKWGKANPMLGVSPKLDQFQRGYIDATQTPGMEAEFRTKALSEWLNSASTWLQMLKWDMCADPAMRIERFRGLPCCIGGDMSQNDDIAAVAYSFMVNDLLWTFVDLYLPEDVVLERAQKVPEYRKWVEAGIIKLTPGSMIDLSRVEADVAAACNLYAVKDIAFDQFGSIQLVGNLYNSGKPARIEAKNSSSFTPPSKELETRIKHLKFRHQGNSCLRWQASNVVVSRRTDGSILPKKETAESENKIDGIDAIIRSISGWLKVVPAEKKYQMMIFGR